MKENLNSSLRSMQDLKNQQNLVSVENSHYKASVSNKSSYFVSVVCPLQNDGNILSDFLAELSNLLSNVYHNHEIILIDTADHMRKTNIDLHLKAIDHLRYICLSRNFGIEMSISAGLDHAIGDVVVVLRPAYDPIELIPEFVDRVVQSNKIVVGLEANRKSCVRIGLAYRISKNFYYWAAKKLLDFELPPQNATLFTAFSRQTLNAIISIKDRSRYLRIFSTIVGYENEYVPYTSINRHYSKRRVHLRSAFRSGIDIVVMNSTRLLRYASYLGVFASFMNIIYIIFIFANVLFNARLTPGWLTISFQISSFFLVLFLILTILSEYIVRLLIEVQDRPPYYVLEEKNSAVMLRSKDLRNVVAKSD